MSSNYFLFVKVKKQNTFLSIYKCIQIVRYRPWGPPTLLHNWYPVFSGGKAAGAWRWQPALSSAENNERVESHLFSPLWVFVVCCMENFTFYFTEIIRFSESVNRKDLTQLLNQPLHIYKIYKLLHTKTLKTLRHVSVLRPSSDSYIFLVKITLEIVTY